MGYIRFDGEFYDKIVIDELEKKFVKSEKTDAILVVNQRILHVNKALLSYHSDYFNALSNSGFKEKSMEEIEIKGVKFEDFATLLSLVHDKPLQINRSNYEELLELADRFQIPTTKYLHEYLTTSETPELTIYEKAFAKTDKTDAFLVVDGKKLYVNKALLSYHSDYFKTLFNSEFKKKSKKGIEIEDVKYVHFAMLLSQVLEKPDPITYEYAEGLLILADRFSFRAPKLQLERFIINSGGYSRRDKLVLAKKYNLENLLEHAIGLYNRRGAFQDFYHSHNTDISDALRLKIFDKFFHDFAHISGQEYC